LDLDSMEIFMARHFCILLTLTFCLLLVTGTSRANGPSYTDPKKTDADFALQGEYIGTLGATKTGKKIGVQVIALGEGKFHAVSFVGGLPGGGWNGKTMGSVDGERKDGVLKLGGFEKEGGKTTNLDLDSFEKVHRKSPTLSKKPPKRAVVLFDGNSAEQWEKGKMTEDGLLMQGCTSKQTFGSHRLHLEFRLPYEPQNRGQQRGNSGIYVQGRYEVQMLDSFGLEGKDNECGGVYSVGAPKLNMCYPPLSWQTYDINYTAAKYDKDGNLTDNPRMTVRHNGVVIHKNLKLPGDRNTTAAPLKAGHEPGPVYLQNHNNPVRYRNIWVVERS
jgi:hypothetical protein